MKGSLVRCIFVICALTVARSASSQGWVAEFDLDFNHDQYAFEKINHASLTFSGVTVTGSSTTSKLQLVVRGSGIMSGNIFLSISGLAWEPYYRDNPESQPISATFSGNYKTPCITGFFQQNGQTTLEQVYIWVRIYPRMEISEFTQQCDEIKVSTNTCSRSYLWEVSDDPFGSFKPIARETTSTLSITRDDLVALGFADPYGRKYFRVTGIFNTTSQLQAIDVFYPGPSPNLQVNTPECHNGTDGSLTVRAQGASPSIDDFVVTLFRTEALLTPIRQDYILNGSDLKFSGLSPGQYMLRVENNSDINRYGNCWTDNRFNIANPDRVIISSAAVSDFNGYQVTCQGESDGRIEISPSGGTGPITVVEWMPAVSNSFVADNLTKGQYQVRVADSHDCWSDAYTYEIREPEKLLVALQSTGGRNGYDVSCHDKRDGKISLETGGGAVPYLYEWSDGTTGSLRDNLPPGSYSVKVTDANGCQAAASIDLVAPEPIRFLIEEVQGLTCQGDLTGILEVHSVKNTIGAVTCSWSSGETAKTIINKPAGSYSVNVSDEQGCNTSMSHLLEEPGAYTVNLNPLTNYNGSHIRCSGEANGSLAAIVRNSEDMETNADYYEWHRNGEVIASGPTLSTITDLPSGIYSVSIIYRTTCKSQDTFTLTEPDPVSVEITATSNYNGVPISCSGKTDGSLLASSTGGIGNHSFVWNGGQQTAALRDIGAGTYTVMATDLNGCRAGTEKILIDPPLLEAEVVILSDYHGLPLSCPGASDARLAASASGGTAPLVYEWNSGVTSQEVRGLGAGTHSFMVRDANGCMATADTVIENPPPVKATIVEASDYNGFGVSCFGKNDGYLLAGGEGGSGKYTFKWQGSNHTNALNANLVTGEYRVIVTDENGCYDSFSHFITGPESLSIALSSLKHPSCHDSKDGEITLSAYGGTGTYEFSVSGGTWQSEPILKGLKPGSHLPRVQDMNGCGQTISATMVAPPPVAIHFLDVKPALCGDASGEVTSSVTGGSGAYTYDWRNSKNEFVSDRHSAHHLQAGIYLLTVTDQNLCRVSAPAGITSLDGPRSVVRAVSPATCSYSQDGVASLEVITGNGPFAFRWPDGQDTPQASNLEKGEHFVQIQDVNGCISVQNVFVPAPDSLEVILLESVEPACHGACDGRLVVSAKGGNGDYSYHWQEKTGPALDSLCAGDYVATVSDYKNCVSIQRFQLNEPRPLTAETILQSSPTCPGSCDGHIEIKASGGTGLLQYLWNNGHSGGVADSLCAGVYTTLITDSNQCQVMVSTTLTHPVGSHMELGGPVLLCKGNTHTLDPGPQWKKLTWRSDTGFESYGREVHLSEPGTYFLEATDQLGCVVRDTFLLEISGDLLTADFLLTSEAMTGDTVVLIDISWPLPGQVTWMLPDDMTRIHDSGDIILGRFDKSGTFEVSLKATLGGCRDEMTKSVTIMDDNAEANEGGRLGSSAFLKEFTLFPNPNDGVFDVIVQFQEESFLRLTIWNSLTSRKIGQVEDSGSASYSTHIDMRPLSAGPYTLRLDHKEGSRYIRFIVR